MPHSQALRILTKQKCRRLARLPVGCSEQEGQHKWTVFSFYGFKLKLCTTCLWRYLQHKPKFEAPWQWEVTMWWRIKSWAIWCLTWGNKLKWPVTVRARPIEKPEGCLWWESGWVAKHRSNRILRMCLSMSILINLPKFHELIVVVITYPYFVIYNMCDWAPRSILKLYIL